MTIADVVGAYLLTDTKDHVMIKLTGKTVDVMCEIITKYNSFVSSEKGKRDLCLKLKKTIYDCIQSTILWYDTFKDYLEQLGLKFIK